jgi:hypothetical protein
LRSGGGGFVAGRRVALRRLPVAELRRGNAGGWPRQRRYHDLPLADHLLDQAELRAVVKPDVAQDAGTQLGCSNLDGTWHGIVPVKSNQHLEHRCFLAKVVHALERNPPG